MPSLFTAQNYRQQQAELPQGTQGHETTTLKPFPLVEGRPYNDFRDELTREGFVVLKGVLSQEKATAFASRCHDWLESFGLGYDRTDSSTWKTENLPTSFKGGLYNLYGISQEQFCWDIRQEPAVIDAFATIWQTRDLLVSFDGANISVPLHLPESDDRAKAWPHVDQSPLRTHLHCIQGIVNLHPNGPRDGGLMVLKGSKALYREVFDKFEEMAPAGGWPTKDQYLFTDEQMKWFEEQGCSWHKVEAGPGDLILWDSRTCHYGAPPVGDNFRIATYVCYKPAKLITPELREKKLRAFEEFAKTTHDPIDFGFVDNREPPARNGVPDKAWKVRHAPASRPVLTEVGRKLAGLEVY